MTTTKLYVLLALFFSVGSSSLGGCYSDVESFAERAARLDCKRLRECRKDVFEMEFDGDMGRCRDEFETVALNRADEFEEAGCDYVPEKARECIKAGRENKKECSESATEDILDACDRVFECPGGAGLQLDERSPTTLAAPDEAPSSAVTRPGFVVDAVYGAPN